MPDPALQATALRYAAGDLPPDEVSAFEARLAEDQDARDALSEAVRLSARAIGQEPPAPTPSFRAGLHARLGLTSYRGQPLAWVALVAACVLVAVALADRADAPEAATAVPAPVAEPVPPPAVPVPVAPPRDAEPVAVEHPPAACGDERSVAEIWADLSNHDGVEKARDDELRWRQRMRELSNPHHVSATAKAAADGP